MGILLAYTVTNVIIAYLLVFYPPKWPKWLSFTKLTGGKKDGDGTRRRNAAETAESEYERELALHQTEVLVSAPRGPFGV